MRSSNPALSEGIWDKLEPTASTADSSNVMTVNGSIAKSGILLGLCVISAVFVWFKFKEAAGDMAVVGPWMFGGMIVGLIFALITCFKPSAAPVTAPLYALATGLFIGGISAMYNNIFYDGIVMQAAGLTFGVFALMLVLYGTGIIQVTQKVRMAIVAATGAVLLIYLIAFIAMMVSGAQISLFQAGPIGIGFSVLVVGIAAFNLVLDFDFIERGSQSNAPKYMEWYAGFALLVTLVWLYLEILRLLAKIYASRN